LLNVIVNVEFILVLVIEDIVIKPDPVIDPVNDRVTGLGGQPLSLNIKIKEIKLLYHP
jgi:hypothetical protein